MKYHKIGERFEYDGVMLEVVGLTGCASCFFNEYGECKLEDDPKYCGSNTRNDNICISYKLVEQLKQKDTEQKTEIIVEGTDEVFATHVDNVQSDEEIYGSAFAEMFDELGIDYAYGKLREKMNRIKVLRNKPNIVENEGLEDALLDTAGYAILTLVELKKRKK